MLNELKNLSLELRKNRDPVAPAISAVLSDASQIAKNSSSDKNNFVVNDDHAITAMKKEIKKLSETISLADPSSNLYEISIREKELLENILPSAPSEDNLKNDIVIQISSQNLDSSGKSIGVLMKFLTEKYGAALDRAVASRLIKECL